jgi:hypothetical protein
VSCARNKLSSLFARRAVDGRMLVSIFLRKECASVWNTVSTESQNVRFRGAFPILPHAPRTHTPHARCTHRREARDDGAAARARHAAKANPRGRAGQKGNGVVVSQKERVVAIDDERQCSRADGRWWACRASRC